MQLLQKDVSNRIGFKDGTAKEVKDQAFFKEINFMRLEFGRLEPPFVPDVSDKFIFCKFARRHTWNAWFRCKM